MVTQASAVHPRENLARLPFMRRRLGGTIAVILGLLALSIVVMVPLAEDQQAWLALGGLVMLLVANRAKGRTVTILLVLLSSVVSLRYMYWRVTDTLDYSGFWQTFLGTGLLLAEIYALMALVLSYVQSIWLLDRKPVPLPADPETWPVVDVFIPTYNEALDIVKPSVFAALALDWPRHKLNVYILDDGKRDEFRAFAEAVGCGYIIRPNNRGAKAGNINHALRETHGEYIVVFDCDHVATNAFLKLTVGWLLRDRELCMVQTPHHFYSPDPFERNLETAERTPNEGLLFYGQIQQGNDFWGGAFFCGSCAVIRRLALVEMGGLPTQTVTEDCHASLRMQRNGWRTAYLKVPLAAGLATERLMLHIGQRMRWARGMIQILRLENPLTTSGLNWNTRLCYFMAMFHYLFPLPRFVFLTTPLAFLLLRENIIAASPLALVAYAGPHILHSVVTASRVQGSVRHSFWSEIYETVLAVYLLPVTLATLLDPRRGRFNVTDKGGTLEEGYFDLRAVGPNMVLAVFLIVGLLSGIYGLATNAPSSSEFQAYALNLVWATLCLLTVLAGLAVGRERRQVRAAARVFATVPATLRLADGTLVQGETIDLSLGGAAIAMARPANHEAGQMVTLELLVDSTNIALPAEILRWQENRLQLRFAPQDLRNESHIVQAVLGRADAWVGWDEIRPDRPLRSLKEVAVSIGGLFRGGSQFTLGNRAPATAPRANNARSPAKRAGLAGLRSLALFITLALGMASALAQPRETLAPEAGPGARRVSQTLRQLGLRAPMQLRGSSDLQGVLFGVRGDEVVTSARLVLQGATSPSLIPEMSQIAVTLNEQVVGTITPDRSRSSFGPMEFPVNPVYFADNNRLNFRFAGRSAVECNDGTSSLLWSTISDQSTLHLTLEHLPLNRDLARLPEPFFDPRLLHEALSLPFVVADGAGNDAIRAAAISASWFAVQADYRGASFPVTASPPDRGNAVIIATGVDSVPGVTLPRFDGPTLTLVPNPNDPFGVFLVVGGRTASEAATAATALAVGREALSGELAVVQTPSLPRRQPYDAPRWLRADRPVKLGDLLESNEMQSVGYSPGPVAVPFRTAPDLYTWRNRPFVADIRFRASPGPTVDVAASRLDVALNDVYLRSFPLRAADGTWLSSWINRQVGRNDRPVSRVGLPPWMVFGQNELQLRFDMRPLSRGDCAQAPGDVRASIDPDSTIDLSSAHRFTTLPNLAFFASSGFPFTIQADQAETAAVLPDRPSAVELSAFLSLIGRMSALVGYPATGLTVVRSSNLSEVADRNLIVVGALGRQQALQQLLRDNPIAVEGNRLSVAPPDAMEDFRNLFGPPDRRSDREQASSQLAVPGEGLGALIAFESPLRAGRSVVALTGSTPAGMEAIVAALRDPEQIARIQGDLALLSGGRVQSYKIGSTYTHGTLPPWLWPQYWLSNQPLLVLVVLAFGLILVAAPLYWVLRRRAVLRLRERSH